MKPGLQRRQGGNTVPGRATRRRAPKSRSLQKRRALWGAVFVAPAMLSVAIFTYYPLLSAVRMAFYEFDIVRQSGKFVGFANFVSLFTRPLYWMAWKNTITLFVYGLLFGFWVPIVQALALGQLERGQRVFRILYILPTIIPGIASLLMWKWIFDPDFGLLNSLLGLVGLGPYRWIYDSATAKLSIGLMGILGGGFGVLIYLAAIKGISKEMFEAAELDGANRLVQIRKIILPQIRNIVLIQLVFAVIGGLQSFMTQFVLTEGGPVNSTLVLNLLIYNAAFRDLRYGYATAIALTLFVAVFALTRLQIFVQYKLEE